MSNIEELEEKLSELVEKDYNEFTKKVDIMLKQAADLISKAETLAEKTGFAFSSPVSPLYQYYCADSNKLEKKYAKQLKALAKIDPDHEGLNFLQEYESSNGDYPCYTGEYDCSGWEHSSVC